jgi:hypothetical protein
MTGTSLKLNTSLSTVGLSFYWNLFAVTALPVIKQYTGFISSLQKAAKE